MANYTDLQLIEIQAATLYCYDTTGRMRSVNEPGGGDDAPRFYMGRTAEGNICRFRYDLPEALVRELAQLCAAEPITRDFTAEPQMAGAIRALLASHAPLGEEYRGPAFLIPDHGPPPELATLITEANSALLQIGFPRMLPLPRDFDPGPIAAVVIDGQAVALCYCSRLTDRAAEAGVDTLPNYQRRGYGSIAVAGWAAAVRARGLLPLYSTAWENYASQRIARRLGMRCYGENWSIDQL
jgi:RimJ/RimL family protein N-acetyltransferase